MKITGKYEKDDSFTYVYSENKIYTIARGTGEWGFVEVGKRTAMGQVLDQGTYDKWESECTESGTFELDETK